MNREALRWATNVSIPLFGARIRYELPTGVQRDIYEYLRQILFMSDLNL